MFFLPGIAINQPVDQTTAHCSRGLRERERESGEAVKVNPQSLSRVSPLEIHVQKQLKIEKKSYLTNFLATDNNDKQCSWTGLRCCCCMSYSLPEEEGGKEKKKEGVLEQTARENGKGWRRKERMKEKKEFLKSANSTVLSKLYDPWT